MFGLQLHDPCVYGSYEVFKTRFQRTFEPPHAECGARAELLDLKMDKRDIHVCAQHTR